MKIITNTAISLDGRINTTQRERVRLGSADDLKLMSVLRNQVDAILVGGNTFRDWLIPLLPQPEHLTEPLRTQALWNIILSRTMDFELSERFLDEQKIRPLFLTNKKIENFAAPIVVHPEITPEWIVNHLSTLGIQTLLIEGGGDLIFQFVKANLVNEMYITLCPKLIGGKGAPSLLDGEGFLKDQIRNLRLLESRVVGDEIFLHYKMK